jgi:hypothetical protein
MNAIYGQRTFESAEVGEGNRRAADADCHLLHAGVRQPEEFIDPAEFVHQLQGRRVDRVAAEITQEVPMLLQDHHVDTLASQQQTRHHASRSAADNTAPCSLDSH